MKETPIFRTIIEIGTRIFQRSLVSIERTFVNQKFPFQNFHLNPNNTATTKVHLIISTFASNRTHHNQQRLHIHTSKSQSAKKQNHTDGSTANFILLLKTELWTKLVRCIKKESCTNNLMRFVFFLAYQQQQFDSVVNN